MIYIFDLDYTLLDTNKFKKNLSSVFGMSAADFNESCFKYFKSKGVNYNPDKHLVLLEEDGFFADKEQAAAIREKLNEFMENIDEYLFPEAEKIVKSLKKRGDKLALATFGNAEWQKLKINALKLKKYFDDIIYEDKNKKENKELKALKRNNEKIILINDNARELRELELLFGDNCEAKLIYGPYSDNCEHKKEIYNNLRDAFEEREQKEAFRELCSAK